jgi:hypothetical protein
MLAVASARSIPTLGAETRKEHVERSSNGALWSRQTPKTGNQTRRQFNVDGAGLWGVDDGNE